MKQVRIAFFFLVLGIFAGLELGGGVAVLHAQTLPGDVTDVTTQQGVAFVKAEGSSASRSILYFKRPNAPVDRYDLAAMVNQISGFTIIDSIRHLSVIGMGMTPNGDRLVLGAEVTFLNTSNGEHQTFYGILQIPWPVTAATLVTGDITSLFLQSAPDIGSFHPEGILSPDGTQWYATMRTSSRGNDTMRFYHGHISGGAVDSATITGDFTQGGTPPQSGWNLSNLALDTTTGGTPTMLVSEVDGLESGGNQSQRIMLMHWQPGAPPSTSDISGKIRNFPGKTEFAIDSLFDLTVSAVQNNSLIRFGLRNVNSTGGTVEFFTANYNNPSNLNTDQTIPSSILPNSTTFFAGVNSFAGANSPVYSDDNPSFTPHHGQGGDMILTNDGRTALFITHEVPDYPNTSPGSQRNVKSAIFSYDLNSNGSPATMLYNDSNAQELQPIFVPVKDTTAHSPYIQSNLTQSFGNVDTSKNSILAITVLDTSTYAGMIVDSARITGTDSSQFSIVSPTFPVTVQHSSSFIVSVKFAPTGTAGTRTAHLTIYSSMTTNKSINIVLNGTAKVLPGGGVKEDASLAQSMSIEPNPFSSIASVRLTAQDAGSIGDDALGIVVHDALGRTVYTSPLQHVGTGASENFDFDAKSLGLPNGIYYVTALFGDRQVSRQVVFVR